MNLIGQRVTHKIFGPGTVVDAAPQRITVDFDKLAVKKIFPFPSCFLSFLTVIDPSLQAQVKSEAEHAQQVQERQYQESAAQAESSYSYKKMHEKVDRSPKTVSVSSCTTVKEFCDIYQAALNSEVYYLKSKGGKRQSLLNGQLIEYANNRFVYSFESEDELHYPDDTPISIWKDQEQLRGSIIQCIDFTVLISTPHNLGKEIPDISFSAEPWQLLAYLSEYLSALRAAPSSLVKALICDGNSAIDPGNSCIPTGQEKALQMSLSQPITFVWGPPGTGKTETLAKIALAHIKKGRRVLMVSYSNVSVDGAILRVHSLSEHSEPGTLVRYGYPRLPDLLKHPYLTSYQLTIHHYPKLVQERQQLIAERKKLNRQTKRYLEIARRLKEITHTLADEERQAVHAASFVATTVSKAIIDNTINQSSFDTVIFDEASMAYIPQIVYAASLAKSSFICMGDFMQLPPIVQGERSAILNGDIFQYCGITRAVEHHQHHRWLCLLDTQYRMHPDISNFASNFMYRRLLKSAGNMEALRSPISAAAPLKECALGLADLSGMMSVCTKTLDESRVNILSSFISAALAVRSAQSCPVGIITPYHAQSRLLHAISRDLQIHSPDLNPISCATVHQFQGSEKDVIFYDAVDCYRMPYPGMLLTSMQNNYANRLFNVALTRAKGKFIGVGNFDYLISKRVDNDLMFGRLIANLRNTSQCLNAKQLIFPRALTEDDNFLFYNDPQGNRFLVQDIITAEKEIRLDIPDCPVQGKWIARLTQALIYQKNQGLTVSVRAENKQNLPAELRSLAIEHPCAVNPIAVIDKEIIWFGAPSSNACFAAENHTVQEIYRPMIRFLGKHTATAIIGFSEMGQISDHSRMIALDQAGTPITNTFSSYVLAKTHCPICGKPLKLQKSKHGKYFLSCTQYPACTHTSLVTVELVEDYFSQSGRYGKLCPKCNCSLEAKVGPYGLYIQCCGAAPHRYKLDEI